MRLKTTRYSKGWTSPETFFHWHGETFDLPEGAEWLAYSEKCRHQAYRYGRKVYGIQFHPEITAEMIADWCEQPVIAAMSRSPGRSIRMRMRHEKVQKGLWSHGSDCYNAGLCGGPFGTIVAEISDVLFAG